MPILPDYRRQPGDVAWEGAVNARRISGIFYRMGRREWLTDQGWRQMRQSGIRRVVDLRNAQEIRRRETDPSVNRREYAQVEVVNLPLEAPGINLFAEHDVPYMNHPRYYRRTCESFSGQLVDVMEYLGSGREPAVIHCSAGRDRSGLIATMLLSLAGKPDEILSHDAAATRGINEWHRVSPRKHPYESYQDAERLERLVADRARGLQEFISWLGGAERFLRSAGMDEGKLEQLVLMTQVDEAKGHG